MIAFAFFSLFLYLDSASRCLPKCFTVIFISIGLFANYLLQPEYCLYTLLYFIVTFIFLRGIRLLFTYVSGSESMGKGDIYLISGLTVWFDYTIAIEIVLVSSVLGSLVLVLKKYRNPLLWNKQYCYRTIPFAPFLCVVAMLYSSYLIGV
ncbi:prepilin peptidase [Morganella psychrotolerans]|uniref:prepilin peptidase n=1 Tax=Morganella psychrotolerans TaxID=368603 RepID=UPI0039AEE0FE